VEFPNLIIPKTTSSSSRTTPPPSRAEINSTNNAKKQQTIVPGSSRSGAGVKVAAKKAAPKAATAKKRAREEDEDEKDGQTSPAKKLRVAKAPKAPKPKKIINHAPTQKLDVFVCGEGSSGELGLGNGLTAIDVKRPRLNHNLSASKVGVVHLAVGGMHAAALTHDGLIYTWGVNDHGALGRDTNWVKGANDEMDVDDDETVDLNPLECTPMPVPRENFPSDTVFTQLACGDSTTFAVTDVGEVWGWGTFRGNDGILGFSKDVKIQSTPTKLPNLSSVKQIVCGANHAMALREDGTTFIWGSGEQNQLGHRVLERKRYDSLLPTPLRLKKKCRLIGCGMDHSFAVEKNKEDVWTWGLNSFGETGIRKGAGGNEAVIFSPTRVPALAINGDTISAITGGAHHSAAITANGKLLVWGRLDGHQLGLDPDTLPSADTIKDSSDQPRILIQPTELPTAAIGTAKMVAVGTDHNVAINTAGQAHSWGFNVNYQCGQGAGSDDIDQPTRIQNTAVKNRDLIWAGAGGQFSMMAAVAEGDDGPE
ncbi:hypothetical protein MMC31_005501, partial [Peltigera leucophlebia]|nr:hypothetical protein [Peltigera leucophlebia]